MTWSSWTTAASECPWKKPLRGESLRANGDLKIIRLAHNQGIEGALNTGLQWIRERGYEFVARLDCGDRNTPHRIARQVEFMDENPDVVLVGTRASYVDLEARTVRASASG